MAPADDGPGRELRLADGAAIAAALPSNGLVPAEWSFANLWLFRARHRYRLVAGPVLHVRGTTYDGMIHALPLTQVDRAAARALAAEGVDCLFPLGEEAHALGTALGLTPAFVAADSDYWYDGTRLATLADAPMRRGQARAFAERERPCWEPWRADHAAEALALLAGWAEDVGRPEDPRDVAECGEGVAQAGVLGLEGGLVRLGDGRAAAFLLASNQGDSRVVHFAKGRRRWSHAYPWMFAAYAAEVGAKVINFEQDLGISGLARSKRAYAPIRIQPKYRLPLAELR